MHELHDLWTAVIFEPWGELDPSWFVDPWSACSVIRARSVIRAIRDLFLIRDSLIRCTEVSPFCLETTSFCFETGQKHQRFQILWENSAQKFPHFVLKLPNFVLKLVKNTNVFESFEKIAHINSPILCWNYLILSWNSHHQKIVETASFAFNLVIFNYRFTKKQLLFVCAHTLLLSLLASENFLIYR